MKPEENDHLWVKYKPIRYRKKRSLSPAWFSRTISKNKPPSIRRRKSLNKMRKKFLRTSPRSQDRPRWLLTMKIRPMNYDHLYPKMIVIIDINPI